MIFCKLFYDGQAFRQATVDEISGVIRNFVHRLLSVAMLASSNSVNIRQVAY